MRVILIQLFMLQIAVLSAQAVIKGHIEPSDDFQNKLYILRHDRIDPHPFVIYDSVMINSNGSFSYTFQKVSPQNLIYKILLPVRSNNRLYTYGTVKKNYQYISLEGNESITLNAKADSLFYSTKILGGSNNAAIQHFADLQKTFYNLERSAMDSIKLNPGLEQEYKQRMMPLWMASVENLKSKVIFALDTAKSTTSILMGLQLLFETNFGKIDSITAEKYLKKVKDQDILLVRTIRALSRAKQFDRTNILLPNISLLSSTGKRKNLYDFKKNYMLIDFWASWCSPCRYANRTELPSLYEDFKDKIDVIGLTIDEDKNKWRKAVSMDKTEWLQYIDADYVLKKALDIEAVPVYLLVDKNNKIVFEAISVYQMHEYLKNLLDQE